MPRREEDDVEANGFGADDVLGSGEEGPRVQGRSVPRISVIVTNYNYDKYVGAAIESALTLSYPDTEVIVVDDGSSDNSRDVIQKYEGSVKAFYIENSTQRVAANIGFANSTGDIVIFLDSDDILPSGLPSEILKVLTAGTSKVGFKMRRIDEDGVAFGAEFPSYPVGVTPAAIATWARKTAAYPTAPGSANAYTRRFLNRILPADESVGDFLDSACLAAAPFFGDVINVPTVVVGYRRHGRNDSDLTANPARFAREVCRARLRWSFAQRQVRLLGGEPLEDAALYRSRELLQLRAAARRCSGTGEGLDRDSLARLAFDALRAPVHPGPEGISKRLLISCWTLAVIFTPWRIASSLIRLRYRAST